LLAFDHKLSAFSTAVIKDNPGGYAKLVAQDFGRFFQPGLMERGDNDDLTTTFGRYNAPENLRLPSTKLAIRTFDEYGTPRYWPAQVLDPYSHVVHLPRLLLAFL